MAVCPPLPGNKGLNLDAEEAAGRAVSFPAALQRNLSNVIRCEPCQPASCCPRE